MTRVMLLIPTASYRAPDFMAAAGKLGLDVVVASDIHQPLADMYPGRWLSLPYHDAERGAAAVARYADRFPLDAVIAVDDPGTLLAARASEELQLRSNTAAAVLGTRDKSILRQRLAQGGIPSPEWRVLRFDQDLQAAAAGLAYPLVVKPLALNGSRGVIRANGPASFLRAARRLQRILALPHISEECQGTADRFLVESFIPGEEVAVEGLLRDGQLFPLAIFDKPYPLDGPYFEETIYVTPSRLPEPRQQDVIAAVQAAADALALTDGPVHAELRVNDRGVWPLDVAARTIGGKCARTLSFGSGMSLEEIVLRHAAGQPLDTLNRETQAAGVMMMPIPAKGRLNAIQGLEDARRTPGIVDIELEARPGDDLIPLPEGANYPGFIFAKAPTPAQAEAALRQAWNKITFDVR